MPLSVPQRQSGVKPDEEPIVILKEMGRGLLLTLRRPICGSRCSLNVDENGQLLWLASESRSQSSQMQRPTVCITYGTSSCPWV